ncbi:hypothetical protein ASPVEDRAFT_78470 [Aspergillus versicolor CBS 583.65]|uniref:AMP-dependent synthetase/ligase domain-containing protein n=1 Tax=Aspergillus versicolor CBS 583.65 TaxID=1036611 RepID=A0A1L9P5A5_ASPVE|nr:uncharacterized protein ASPVEDRAFT_78470 [Aspergillus versicolor CBS 583.65]OJI96715.1 hypothetical protein ASPVEDRAFT_78470 [Aspergillus versicolor CBS 583.65]
MSTNALYLERDKANVSIVHLFLDKVWQEPKSPAVIDINSTISYEELHTAALSLASQLFHREYALEEPTGVLVNPGLWNIITQLAVVYAEGTIVPAYPDDSDEKILSKLKGMVQGVLADRFGMTKDKLRKYNGENTCQDL